MGYFPIDRLPPLAFPSNEKAIRLCADLHRDEWAIHDSFQRLEEGTGEAGTEGGHNAEAGPSAGVRCSPTVWSDS